MKRARRLPSNDSRALDPFGAAPGYSPAGEPAAEESPFAIFEKVHRLLRGRYPWVVGLAVIGATVGAVGGYMSSRPLYQSIGSIHVAPVLPRLLEETEWTRVPPMFQSYVRTRANLLQDPRVLDAAMASDAWRGLGRGISPAERDRFRRSLRVVVEREDPEWIWIRFHDPDPEAARVAVEEIIRAYVERHGPMDNLVTPEMLANLRRMRNDREANIAEIQERINLIGNEYGTNELAQIHDDAVLLLRQIDQEVSQLEWEVERARERLAAGEGEAEAAVADAADAGPLPLSEIASRDPMMQRLLAERMSLSNDIEGRRGRFGDSHRTMVTLSGRLQAMDRQIEDYAQRWLREHPGQIPGVRLGGTVTPETVAALEAQLRAARPHLQTAHERARSLNSQRLQVERLQSQLGRERDRLAVIEGRLNALSTEQPNAATQRVNIVSRGDISNSPAIDNRKKLAALGMMFGGGLPIGLFLLWGLMDGRYRYAEDTDSGGRVALLGVLPYLPGGMNDPEQAGIAAHCVHQIRTMLQIGASSHGRKVFAITSPTAGDGKTSLSLSLGLSFAASGARTCLIDFDLIGAGLTAAMQIKTDLGVLDAIDRGHLNGHVRSTSFARLSLLPVGENDAQEVSRLSPAAVRRLLDQTRDEFDVVIIDTGPVLGSIEAALACAEADGVVVTIGRGQHRSIAERSLNHLNSIGARVAGIVFNRAQGGDFRRTMASTSIRSVPLQNAGGNGRLRHLPALGPMASSVATESRGEESDDR